MEHDRTHGGYLVVPHPEDPDCHWPAEHDMDECDCIRTDAHQFDPSCANCRKD